MVHVAFFDVAANLGYFEPVKVTNCRRSTSDAITNCGIDPFGRRSNNFGQSVRTISHFSSLDCGGADYSQNCQPGLAFEAR